MLQENIDEIVTALAKHIRELHSARKVYKEAYASMNDKQREYLNNLTVSAVKDAKVLLADTHKLMEAVVKYAYGTAELEKRAAAESEEIKKAAEQKTEETKKAEEKPEVQKQADIRDILDEIEREHEAKDKGPSLAEALGLGANAGIKEDEGDVEVPLGAVETGAGGELVVDTDKLASSKEARAAARVKLAQQGLLGFNELSNQAHPGGSADAVSAANLDVKPSVPGSAFHVYKDLKDAMMELANMPPRVRKQAEAIQALVSEGRMKAEDVDKLVSRGVDPEAVKYWKAMWGEAKDQESKEFADKLTQEHAKAKQAEEIESHKARIKRAYQMANQMVAKGFISESQVDAQASDIMNWNDAGFESFKGIIAKQPVVKQASVPAVGLLDSGSVILPAAEPTERVGGTDIKGFFDEYFNKKGLKF
jgi:hypothetical protein